MIEVEFERQQLKLKDSSRSKSKGVALETDIYTTLMLYKSEYREIS